MREPPRLVDAMQSEEGRALLRAARAYAPSDRARRSTLLAVGVGVASSVPLGAGAATSVIKWIGAVTVSATLFGSVMPADSPPTAEPRGSSMVAVATRQSIEARPTPRLEAPSLVDQPPADVTTATATPPPPSASTRPAERPRPALAKRPASIDSTLSRETARLDEARRALEAGNVSGALSTLERYDRDFPRGALIPEARVVYIEALVRHGHHAKAQAVARQFLARYPRSPHAARVHSMLGVVASPTAGVRTPPR